MAVKKSKAAVNIKKNRLTITVAPKITKKSLDNLYTEIRFGVADLQPGFDVITDLSACTLGALSGLPTFIKISNHLINSKVGRVVRVIDETKIIKKQLINIATRSQGYKAEIFNSLGAADEYLSNTTGDEGLYFGLHEQSLNYIYEEQSGTAVVESLSIHFCEVKDSGLSTRENEPISMAITFEPYEGLLEQFEAEAVIVWADGDKFGARFEGVDEALKEKLWQRLVHESQCELS